VTWAFIEWRGQDLNLRPSGYERMDGSVVIVADRLAGPDCDDHVTDHAVPDHPPELLARVQLRAQPTRVFSTAASICAWVGALGVVDEGTHGRRWPSLQKSAFRYAGHQSPPTPGGLRRSAASCFVCDRSSSSTSNVLAARSGGSSFAPSMRKRSRSLLVYSATSLS
jgi:hypothetical protein